MEEMGLWRLFFATGLPEAYLAIRGTRSGAEDMPELPARTAFRSEKEPVRRA